jgi:dehydrogenase/reductase SDR family member 7B
MKDKVVIITGGSSGIGLACATVFGKNGSKIVITGRDTKKLLEAEKSLKQLNIDILTVNADSSNEEGNKLIMEKTIEKFGKIDVLINNAGISMRALFEELELDVIRKVMDINFWGTVYATKYALPEITKNKGSVIGISSIAGYRGLPGRTGYSASKFAMHGFLESLRTELLKKDVHVLLACPGFTATNIRNTALAKDGNIQGESPRDEEKMMTADEVAETIYKATISRKRDLVLTSQGKLTVLLNKFFPAFMDKMVYNHMAKEKDSPFK